MCAEDTLHTSGGLIYSILPIQMGFAKPPMQEFAMDSSSLFGSFAATGAMLYELSFEGARVRLDITLQIAQLAFDDALLNAERDAAISG